MAALYRKYRPQDFDDVVGQEAVTRTLKNAIAHGQIRQAYMFAGPRGTGKTSMARILAKALNCEHGPTPTPDKTCHACRAIAEGTSLDATTRLATDIAEPSITWQRLFVSLTRGHVLEARELDIAEPFDAVGFPETVAEAREHPEVFAGKGIG